ncbi:hypothetical protein ADK67_14820 [Saccharothrix sp. NRRL B-16348]|nr:hypothetical protein ADK67_14820 [Saccharothrix sp. NRRL B-16348]
MVSTPATAGSVVDSHGWSAELHGTVGGDLVLAAGLGSEARATEVLDELTTPGDLTAGAPVELSLTAGTVPPEGVTVRRRLDSALQEGQQASIAFFDPGTDTWTAIPTTLSEDRKTLTAQVDHFTTFTDFVYNVFTRRRDKPSCHGTVPDWAGDATFFDDRHSPMRWCVGGMDGDPDIMVVKVAGNRAYGTAVVPAAVPQYTEDTLSKSLRGLAGEDLLQQLMTRALSPSGTITDLFGGRVLLPGGEEVELRFTEAQVRAAGDQPLITADPSPVYALAGQMYDAVSAVVGQDNRGVAIAMTMAMAGQCLHDLTQPAGRGDALAAAAEIARCAVANADHIAQQALAMVLTKANGSKVPAVQETTERIKLARRAMILVWLAGKVLQLAEWFLDRELPPAAWALSPALKPLRLTFHGYGPLTIGLTAEQAMATGVADLTAMRIGRRCTALADGGWSADWEQRLSTLITAEAGRTVGVNPPRGVRTDKGIGVGSTAQEVRVAYPGHRDERLENERGSILLIAGPEDLYLGFQLGPGDIVTDILAGQRDYASGFELCSGS